MTDNTSKKRGPGRPPKNELGSNSEKFEPNSNETGPIQEDLKNSFDNSADAGNMPKVKKEDPLQAARDRRKARREGRAPGASELKLAATPIKDYILRWVNDDKDRIQRLKDDGWDLVKKNEVTAYSSDDGDNVSQVTGAGGLRSILMKLPEELRQEDMAIKRGRIDAKVADARNAASGKGSLGKSHVYIPKGVNSEFEI